MTSLFPSIPIVGIDFSIRACFISFEMEILGDEDNVDVVIYSRLRGSIGGVFLISSRWSLCFLRVLGVEACKRVRHLCRSSRQESILVLTIITCE